jgi:hypothetical protein
MMTTYTSADLQLAQQHVAQGERHVDAQKKIIAKLKESDCTAELLAQAEGMLVLFKSTLTTHRDHYRQIAQSLQSESAELKRLTGCSPDLNPTH